MCHRLPVAVDHATPITFVLQPGGMTPKQGHRGTKVVLTREARGAIALLNRQRCSTKQGGHTFILHPPGLRAGDLPLPGATAVAPPHRPPCPVMLVAWVASPLPCPDILRQGIATWSISTRSSTIYLISAFACT